MTGTAAVQYSSDVLSSNPVVEGHLDVASRPGELAAGPFPGELR